MVDLSVADVAPSAFSAFSRRRQIQLVPENAASEAPFADLSRCTLARGEVLFRVGGVKTHIYRVETGVLCVTSPMANGPPEIVELVFPGGLLGLGFLDYFINNATAVVESQVSVFPLDALATLCEQSPDARERQAQATAREFAHRRRQLVTATENEPLLRVAAFLSVVSQINLREGRDPHVISESLTSGEVASLLRMDIDTLASSLAELQRRNLVSQDAAGKLLLLDPTELELLTFVS
jgi:CRP/FNR family transcriptional regulator